MNWISRDSPVGGRNIPAVSSLLLQQQLQRGRSLAIGGAAREAGDEGLDLFARNRGSLPVSAAEESDGQNVPPNLERISVGSAKLTRSGMDDLLSAADMGKHDYDWLLTPPGTPLFPSSDASEAQLFSVAPRSNSSARSATTTKKASRFSAPQSENNRSGRSSRSNSVTRPSISTTYSSSHFSNNSNRTSVLNTSTASVTSSRPSTPGGRSNTLSVTRQSPPASSRPSTSRPSTPAKTRPAPISPGDKARPLHGSRPSTPTSRHQVSSSFSSNSNSVVTASDRTRPLHGSRPSTPTSQPHVPSSLSSNSNSTITRPTSRPSTPTRRAPAPSSAPVATRSPSVGQTPPSNKRNSGPSSRPSSPGPRARPSTPLVLPGFPLDVPPNLRTKLPERPASAGRTRPGLALTVRTNVNSEAVTPTNLTRRQSSSPIVTRGRLPENPLKQQLQSNGREAGPPEIQKPVVSESIVRKPIKTATTTESTGFGRTISKKSLDMAVRHMDIRQGIGGIRGTSIFPSSIRSTAPRGRPACMSDPVVPIVSNGTDSEDNNFNGSISAACNGAASENGDINVVNSPETESLMGRNIEADLFESSRYDALLLKEDSKNMNWLHSIEDKSDQSIVFDHRFEPLPEPFGLI